MSGSLSLSQDETNSPEILRGNVDLHRGVVANESLIGDSENDQDPVDDISVTDLLDDEEIENILDDKAGLEDDVDR